MNARHAEYVPRACVWELTLACNMRCIHCGSVAGQARDNELELHECFRAADDLLELGCRQVTLIGGEVFFYRGWEQVARWLVDGGAAVNIITNGSVMGDAEIEQIKFAHLTNVGISVDGMQQNHNRIRGRSSSFEKVLAAFDRLRQADVSIGVVTTLLEFNLPDLEQMYELFVIYGVQVWQLQIGTAMGSAAVRRAMLLDPSKMPQITRFIRDKRLDGRLHIYAGDDIGYFDENEPYLRSIGDESVSWQGCQAGLRVVGIDSVGNVKGCTSMYGDEFIEGNVRRTSLSEIWDGEGNFAYNRNFDVSLLEGKCTTCDMGPICRGGCRGTCYFTTGSLFENLYCNYGGDQAAEPTGPCLSAWAVLS